MPFILGIDEGHNAYPDIGARGWMFEDNGTADVGDRVIHTVNTISGYQAVLVTPKGQKFNSVIGSLGKRCQNANNAKVNGYVSIHMNAGNGHGVEIYATSDSGRRMAEPVLNQLVILGFTNRGIKDGSHLYVLRNTNAPAILIEMCFCDNTIDQKLYNASKIANAIAAGLTHVQISSIAAPAPIVKSLGGYSYRQGIALLQRVLNQMGIRDSHGCALAEDGIDGTKTYEAVNKCLIRRGATSPLVGWVQHQLKITQDNSYGNAPYHQTYDAIIAFQRRAGLVVDGVIGPSTIRALMLI